MGPLVRLEGRFDARDACGSAIDTTPHDLPTGQRANTPCYGGAKLFSESECEFNGLATNESRSKPDRECVAYDKEATW